MVNRMTYPSSKKNSRTEGGKELESGKEQYEVVRSDEGGTRKVTEVTFLPV